MKRTNGRSAMVAGMLAAALAVGATGTATAAEPRLVKIKATDNLQYDVKTIQAKPGESIKVALTAVSALSKAEMSHNFVLLAKGTNVDAFAMDAAMARDNAYIPKAKASSILAQTKLAGGGETVEVTFNAPTEPGEYIYICSFPGHYLGGTKGKLIVK